MTLGKKIVAAREKAGLNQYRTARLAGVHLTTLRQLEADVPDPKNIRLVVAAALLDVLAPYLKFKDFLPGFDFKRISSVEVKVK